jgi:hypothetical protein
VYAHLVEHVVSEKCALHTAGTLKDLFLGLTSNKAKFNVPHCLGALPVRLTDSRGPSVAQYTRHGHPKRALADLNNRDLVSQSGVHHHHHSGEYGDASFRALVSR